MRPFIHSFGFTLVTALCGKPATKSSLTSLLSSVPNICLIYPFHIVSNSAPQGVAACNETTEDNKDKNCDDKSSKKKHKKHKKHKSKKKKRKREKEAKESSSESEEEFDPHSR